MGTLAKKLKELRGELSLYEVGKITGINRGDLKRFEDGSLLPKPDSLAKLAEYYEVPYEELYFEYLEEIYPTPAERHLIIQWAEKIKSSTSS